MLWGWETIKSGFRISDVSINFLSIRRKAEPPSRLNGHYRGVGFSVDSVCLRCQGITAQTIVDEHWVVEMSGDIWRSLRVFWWDSELYKCTVSCCCADWSAAWAAAAEQWVGRSAAAAQHMESSWLVDQPEEPPDWSEWPWQGRDRSDSQLTHIWSSVSIRRTRTRTGKELWETRSR